MQRELNLVKRENRLMRESQYLNAPGYLQPGIPENASMTRPRINVAAWADLLSPFGGDPKEFESWEKQFAPDRATYRVDEGPGKITIRMRLKERALQWLQSRLEQMAMSVDSCASGVRKDSTARRRLAGHHKKEER